MAKTTVGQLGKDLFIQNLVAQFALGQAALSQKNEAFTTSYRADDRLGFIIHRVEYVFQNPLRLELDAVNDRVKFGLSYLLTQPAAGFEAESVGVLDFNSVTMADTTTAVESTWEQMPIVKDFGNLPGGGLIAHPVNLYFWGWNVQATTLTKVMSAKIYYTRIALTDALHAELWQAIYVRQQT